MIGELELTFQVLTPMFLHGSEPRYSPDLRPPSLKGALRFWYRAVDPDFRRNEPILFGTASNADQGSGQSLFNLRIEPLKPLRFFTWDDRLANSFHAGHGTHRKNGLIYLGYPFQMRKKKGVVSPPPQAIDVGTRFKVRCILPRFGDQEKYRKAIAASFWLLGHYGGLGSRSRRGFGSIALLEWKGVRGEWPELEELPLLHKAITPREWGKTSKDTREMIRNWFPKKWDSSTPMHPHIGEKFTSTLSLKFRNDKQRFFDQKDWPHGLNEMGRRLQDYRVRHQPDYQNVKDHIEGDKNLRHPPERVAFGLPLAFQYSSLPKDRRRLQFFPPEQKSPGSTRQKSGPQKSGRHASLLHLRLILLNGNLYPLYLRMGGAVPGDAGVAVTMDRPGTPLLPISDNLLDQFMTFAKGGWK
ncbi:MAG: hypothetical protein HQL52_10500 [Magnetococcales bacterium]|nr:hypothetical protein [Magnetococcales bacterium]